METIESILGQEIRSVIAGYPEIGKILAEHGVGCVTCQVGTCLVRDIVAIHGLPPEEEAAVMAGIAAVLAPGSAASPDPDAGAKPGGPPPREEQVPSQRYSPPLAQLVEEHRLIKRWIALIPAVVAEMDLERARDRRLVLEALGFVRAYADQFHHAKEEDILFGYFSRHEAIVGAFTAEHEIARRHVRQAAEAVMNKDRDAAAEHLAAYGELLTSHIEREDEVLYPWMDRELTTSQVGEIHSRFAAVDAAAGPRFTRHHTALVEEMERLYPSGKTLV